MATWRVARSLDTLLSQLNAAAPRRSKVSDGSIGDAAHASRDSDHNPWIKSGGLGVVTARDFTHDPNGGLDCNWLAKALVASDDPRIKYVIWNRRIYTPGRGWAAYKGTNPHDHHLHLSVSVQPGWFDSTLPWSLPGAPASPITTLPVPEDDMPTAQEVVAALLETRIARGDGTTVLVREALAHGSIVKTGMFDGGSSMPYGASLIRILDDIPRRMWATNVQRNGQQIPALQELADAKTMVGQLVGEVAGLASALADVQGGQPVDLPAVQEAARAGAAEAIAAGVTVTIDVPATRPEV